MGIQANWPIMSTLRSLPTTLMLSMVSAQELADRDDKVALPKFRPAGWHVTRHTKGYLTILDGTRMDLDTFHKSLVDDVSSEAVVSDWGERVANGPFWK